MEVVVRGDGAAASCCAYLLSAAGFGVTAERAHGTGVPALMLSARTQRLICDVFQREDLFRGLPRVDARIVAWGVGSQPRRIEHSSVVVSARELSERFNLPEPGVPANPDNGPLWTVFASRPLPASSQEHCFGSRVASVLAVDLTEQAQGSVCWIESLGCGWLFLLPGPAKTGWLLAVGAPHESLLPESRLVAPQIQTVGRVAGHFPAYPGMAVPFSGPKWLACGSAAMAFDPLCGDGTGNAIREAILVAAVIRALDGGEREEQLLEHYRARLLAGFARHLQLCREFYTAGRSGPWWDAELEFIHQGIEYCKAELERTEPFRYRLQGLELRAV